MRRILTMSVMLLALVLPATAARAQALVADISDHLIAVTTGFAGTRLLLFGAMDGIEGGDIVIVIRGPDRPLDVRRKARVGGIWVNRDTVNFGPTPSFYYVASNRPLDEIADARDLSHYEIGFDSLRLRPIGGAEADDVEFRTALVRNKQRDGLYRDATGGVSLLGGRLFRADVEFPSNVPTGNYVVTTYLFRDGVVAGAQSTPLVVSKIGFGAQIFDFAHRYSALYGVVAIVIALFAGWLAGAVFRKA